MSINLQNILLGIVLLSSFKFRKSFFSKIHFSFLAFFLLSLIVAIIPSPDRLGIIKSLKVLKGIIIFGLIFHLLRSFSDMELIKRSLWVLGMVVVGISMLTIFQVLTYYIWGVEWASLLTHDPFGNRLLIPKVSAIFSGHRKLGLICGLFFPYFLFEFLINKNKRAVIWLSAILFAIITSYSRLAYISILITIIMSVLIYLIRMKKTRLLLLTGITFLALLPVFGILTHQFNPISTYRYLKLWQLDIKYFIDSPLFGHGLGYFEQATGGSIPHSGIFDILIGTGIVGLILYFTPIIDIGIRLVKSWFNQTYRKTERFLLYTISCQIMIVFFTFLIKEIHYFLLTYPIFGFAATFLSIQARQQSTKI